MIRTTHNTHGTVILWGCWGVTVSVYWPYTTVGSVEEAPPFLRCHPMRMLWRDARAILKSSNGGRFRYTVVLCGCRGVTVRVFPERVKKKILDSHVLFSLHKVTLTGLSQWGWLPFVLSSYKDAEAWPSVHSLRAQETPLTHVLPPLGLNTK